MMISLHAERKKSSFRNRVALVFEVICGNRWMARELCIQSPHISARTAFRIGNGMGIDVEIQSTPCANKSTIIFIIFSST